MDQAPTHFDYSQLMKAGKDFYLNHKEVFDIAEEVAKNYPKVAFYLKDFQEILILVDAGNANMSVVEQTFIFFKHVVANPEDFFKPGYDASEDITLTKNQNSVAEQPLASDGKSA